MTARPALGTGGSVVTAKDHRLALAGMTNGASGVLFGLDVTATAPASMGVRVAAGSAVVAYAAQGVYVQSNDASFTVTPLAAAPGSGLRYDLICIRQQDFDLNGSITAANFHIVQGSSGANPAVPAVPDGSALCGTVRVSAGNVTITSGNINPLGLPPRASMRGAIMPVASATVRSAIVSPKEGMLVYREDLNDLEVYTGSTWQVPYAVGEVGHAQSTSDSAAIGTGGAAIANPSLVVGHVGTRKIEIIAQGNFYSGNSSTGGVFVLRRNGPGGNIYLPGGETTQQLAFDGIGSTWRIVARDTCSDGLTTYSLEARSLVAGTIIPQGSAVMPRSITVYDMGPA